MKHQQVVVDYWTMLKTSFTCLLLALSGYVLIKMVQTIFFLPGYLKNNQKRLEELAAKYNLDLEKDIPEAELVEDELEEYENKNTKENENNKKSIATNTTTDADITSDSSKECKKIK